MGNYLGRSKTSKRILMMGLDAAGKTTILYSAKATGNQLITTIPTIGFNVEELTIGGNNFMAWDVGGRSNMRPLWRHYYQDTEGIVFVVDTADKDRMPDVKNELVQIMAADELQGVPVLIFANKSDIPNAITAAELAVVLDLGAKVFQKSKINVVSCCATTKKGVWEGMAWLSDAVDNENHQHMFFPFVNYFSKIASPSSSQKTMSRSLSSVAPPK